MFRTIRFGLAVTAALMTALQATAEGPSPPQQECPDRFEQQLHEAVIGIRAQTVDPQRAYEVARTVEIVCADRVEALGLSAFIYSALFSPASDRETRHALLNDIWRVQLAQDRIWNEETNPRILVHAPGNVFDTTKLDTRGDLYVVFQRQVIPALMALHVEGADVPIYDVPQHLQTCPWPIDTDQTGRAGDEASGLYSAIHADRSKVDIDAGAHRLRELRRVCSGQSAQVSKWLTEYLASASRFAEEDGDQDTAKRYAGEAVEAALYLINNSPGNIGAIGYLKSSVEPIINEFRSLYPDL